MNTSLRYIFLALGLLLGLHYILTISHEGYGRSTSISNIVDKISPSRNHPTVYDTLRGPRRAKAAFVILARNNELDGVVQSIKQMEDRFNKKYKYPYVFLNDVEFDEVFKNRTTEVVSSETFYGLIPHEHWHQPDWIDETRATAARQKMIDHDVIYGGSVPYRNMCRFNSGFFWRHELLKPYRYYWRIEPDIKYFCDLDYDPFLFMQDNEKVYGWTITMYEYEATIPTLWDAVTEFREKYPQYIAHNNSMQYLSDDGGRTYNLCHFWSNFEIGDLDFWRGEAYKTFFEFLDSKGGFYYERWGDAPVHSIGAGLLLPRDKIHFFKDIGYEHNPYQHCPTGEDHKKGKCWCNPDKSFDYDGYSCMKQWDAMWR